MGQYLHWASKNHLKRILTFLKLSIFLFSLIRITSYLLWGKHCLDVHQILIHYLWLYLRACLFYFPVFYYILAHKCSNLFSEIKRSHFIWIHFHINIIQPFNSIDRMLLKFSNNKIYLLPTIIRCCIIGKITYITTHKIK